LTKYSPLINYLPFGVLQEKQLRTGLNINITMPGDIYQVLNMTNF